MGPAVLARDPFALFTTRVHTKDEDFLTTPFFMSSRRAHLLFFAQHIGFGPVDLFRPFFTFFRHVYLFVETVNSLNHFPRRAQQTAGHRLSSPDCRKYVLTGLGPYIRALYRALFRALFSTVGCLFCSAVGGFSPFPLRQTRPHTDSMKMVGSCFRSSTQQSR
jgi:hypothetical protein